MNIDPSSIPAPVVPSLQLKIFNLSEVESEDVRQKGADPDDYISVEWQCPKMTFCGLSEKGEYLMQAWFLIPPGFLKLNAGPTLYDPQGEPLRSPEQIQQSFFPYGLPTFRALVRKNDLSAEVPIPIPVTIPAPTGEEGS
jgi:hypothetical protein